MRVYELSDGFGFEHLQFTERPDPQPAPGEVLIRLRAASLNYRDLMIVQGKYNPKMALPRIPLSDGAGEIVALGKGVTSWKIGDRVVLPFFPAWGEGPYTREKGASALGGEVDGQLRELATFPANVPVPIPAHLSFAEAATLPCAAVTAWHGLFEAGSLAPGQTVLIQGTGGVSLFGLQLAKAAGAEVVLISSSDEKLGMARTLGADHLINYQVTPEWDKAVLEVTSGQGVDVTLEVGGSGTLERTLRATKPEGRVSLIGVLSGRGGEINTAQILHKAIGVQGIYVGSRAMFASLNRALSWHEIRPVIDHVFAFDQAPEAFRLLESAKHFGKIVITLE